MVKDTATLIESGFNRPIFEATFQHQGVLIRMDVLIPDGSYSKIQTSVRPVNGARSSWKRLFEPAHIRQPNGLNLATLRIRLKSLAAVLSKCLASIPRSSSPLNVLKAV